VYLVQRSPGAIWVEYTVRLPNFHTYGRSWRFVIIQIPALQGQELPRKAGDYVTLNGSWSK
jgi:hypothetical protein